jgi:signal transduction histidine kinase
VDQARILVVSDDRKFVDSIVQSWQRMRYSTEFAVAGADSAGEFARYAVILTDNPAALPRLAAGVVLAIAVTDGETAGATSGATREEALPAADCGPCVVRIPRSPGWADHAAALAQESQLRLEAQAQVVEMKHRLRELERFAAVGRFILEARHGLGNALTGVLGNSELLLLEAGAGLRVEERAQLETIHAMSLTMHETFHRLSSLEMELRVTARQAERETKRRPA